MTHGTQHIGVDVPVFETERLRFRAPSMDNLEDEIAFFGSDRSVGVGGPLPPDQVWRSLSGILGHWVVRGYGFWGVDEKATGAYVGRIGPWFPHDWPEPEIGWTVMAHAEGRGLAHEGARAARAMAAEWLGWTTAISLILPTNTRSKALAARLGAVREEDYQHPKFGPVEIWRHESMAP